MAERYALLVDDVNGEELLRVDSEGVFHYKEGFDADKVLGALAQVGGEYLKQMPHREGSFSCGILIEFTSPQKEQAARQS